jgi:peptide/nickel transport system permease protein
VSVDASSLPALLPDPAQEVARESGHGALRFVARRVLAGVLTLIAVSLVTFAALQLLPGNVASIVLGRAATPQAVHLLDHRLHLDTPFFARYVDWVGSAAHGNFGDSTLALAQGLPNPKISSLISQPLTNTLILAGLTIALLIPLSILLGVLSATYADRLPDHVISVLTLIFTALPEFVVGSILILIFFSATNLLPPVTLVPAGASPFDHPDALIMPVATLLLTSLAWTTRLVRVGMLEVLRSDFIRAERLNGLTERRVVWRDAVRNGLAPSIQVFALSIQYLVGGVIVTETVFSYPGLGTQLVSAVLGRDVTEVQAITVIVAAAYIAINILADLLVVYLVPKLRTSL